jgi:cytochrome c6
MNKIAKLSITLVVLASFQASSFAADDAAKSLYQAKCAACHGADGTGNTPAGKKLNARDFHAPEVLKQTDAELLETMMKGKNKMPAYKDKLKEDELKSLVAYVRELGKKK